MSPLDIERLMIHEAVHIGYKLHDAHFVEMVRAYGGAVSESGLAGVKVERKEGARYRVIATFATEGEALAWAKEERARHPGQYRLTL